MVRTPSLGRMAAVEASTLSAWIALRSEQRTEHNTRPLPDSEWEHHRDGFTSQLARYSGPKLVSSIFLQRYFHLLHLIRQSAAGTIIAGFTGAFAIPRRLELMGQLLERFMELRRRLLG